MALSTYVIYSFSTLKLIKVFNKKAEAVAFLIKKKIVKSMLVEFRFSGFSQYHGDPSLRLAKTPDKIVRGKFSDCRKSLHWTQVDLD